MAFDQSQTVNGVTVTVRAEPGVFPAGAALSVKRVPTYKARQADAAIGDVRDEDANVAVSYTFDIKVIDPETRRELQPAEGRKVEVSFAVAEVADGNLETSVYHIDGSGEAQKLDVATEITPETGEETTAVVETEGFSLYTVEFTYNTLKYVLPGNTSVPMSEILSDLGLSGEAETVSISDPGLFSASNESGEWVVTAHRAFDTAEWMKVTINGVTYEITVTDDNDVKHSGTWGTCAWEISEEGVLTVHRGVGVYVDGSPWAVYADDITSVAFKAEDGQKVNPPADCAFLLSGLGKVERIDASGLNTSNVTGMRGMFAGCAALASLDLSSWDTGKVKDMSGMFELCAALKSLNLSGWDTGAVEDMRRMFDSCSQLVTIRVGASWSATDMSDGMFSACRSLVGGAGTVHDVNHTDAAYAHIDFGADDPGYLTFSEDGSFIVIFSSDGGSPVKNQIITDGENAVRPVDEPTKDGFRFLDWYRVTDGGMAAQPFDFKSTPITANTKLKAKWAPLYAVVIPDGIENGTVTAKPDTAAEGETVILTVAPEAG